MVVEPSPLERIDEVDGFMERQDGMIHRNRDLHMCRHSERQKCSHCLPLDPFDDDYLKSKDIKHMSFHAYLRKLTAGHGKGTQLKRPLESIDYKLKPNCPGHKPYPQGICTKCRPTVVTLNRQRFRHVDNISIENEHVVNRFLDYWRKTSHQRAGYLIGRYEPFYEVPLGIKATVAAIYEPPQTSSGDSLKFEDDPNEEAVDYLCDFLGLRRVGWIFTDLWSADATKGTVHCTRNKDSFFLSAEECITAGYFQNKYKNYTNHSSDGYFGSKFTTVVASGDQNEQINFSGYQVSNQCAALVDAELLCPTSHPELAYLREKPLRETQYITDVQYMEKNEYGVETRRDGRPMPVEYMLVDVPAGMPKEPHTTFYIPPHGHDFPTENRILIGELQDAKAVGRYLSQFSKNQFLELATNFHFLLFLMTNEIVKFTREDVKSLCECVRTQDRGKAMDWADSNTNWATLSALSEHAEELASSRETKWSCKHCTFENDEGRIDCSMCGLPRTS
ncbi:hypothetical protein AB6A40_000276 [Gnathostoma spinigerum]|uniref:Nuclear protein localization protein 4 n=1 Tax=Gnathostoma spinigerum TaxID=75299 RepID=A0ABD6EAS4_9BILA